jgi:hypothetical protein
VARITGADKHKRRLQRLRGPAMVRGVTRALYAVAQDIQVDAQISITAGATSGKNHVPSAPGEPPNNDTGVLAGNIEATSTGPLKAETSSNAPYGAAQELGSESQNLPERPYLRPAAQKNRPNAMRKVAAAVDRVVRSAQG